jgi:2-polyprenyl-3-methyl-5-hydroxy-6-metoxy-1,4-benzoquinol methylase
MKSFGKCPVCDGEAFKKTYNKKWHSSSFVRCDGCGLVFQNPQEDPVKTISRYGEEYFKYEKENEHNFFRLIEMTINDFEILKLLPAGADVLEVGSATGLFLKFMKEKGYKPVGIEICGDSANYGIKQYGVDIINCSLEDAVFDRRFDFVHFSHLIEHLNDPFNFLKKVYDLLNDKGYALITTPNSSGLFASYYDEDWRCIVDDHLFLFNKKNLEKLLVKTGFKIIKSMTWGGIPAGKAFHPLKRTFDRFVKFAGVGDVVCFLVSK